MALHMQPGEMKRGDSEKEDDRLQKPQKQTTKSTTTVRQKCIDKWSVHTKNELLISRKLVATSKIHVAHKTLY